MTEHSLKKLALEEGEVQVTGQAFALWKITRDLCEEGQEIVLGALDERVGPARPGPAQELATKALRTCKAEAGSTARSAYIKWREGTDDPGAWPTVKFVHRAFGSWPEARRAVGDASPSQPADHRLWVLPDATPEELQAELAVWVGGLGAGEPGRQQDFLSYLKAKQGSSDVECLYPRSASTLRNRLGPWAAALRRAGLVNPGPVSSFTELVGDRFDFGAVAPTGRQYDIEQLAGWASYLRELLGTRGLMDLTRAQYRELREVIRTEAWERQVDAEVPSFGTINVIAGSWAAFKALSGIREPEREPSSGAASGSPRYSQGAIVNAVRDAASQIGAQFTIEQYCTWREREADRGRIRPSFQSIYTRLGGGRRDWDRLIQGAISSG